ncbi:hypothetical protein GDO86_018635 [Hymenochirus boettgeri]|uniref:Uncharacterized protein n=1 Tax=Hymenochirus boettgeri TaxID=247094 RepID=A0A8T2IMV3_9PIPI|nr:hypothetical protein GDO86_018635 [Hymenochirus boettgeri]
MIHSANLKIFAAHPHSANSTNLLQYCVDSTNEIEVGMLPHTHGPAVLCSSIPCRAVGVSSCNGRDWGLLQSQTDHKPGDTFAHLICLGHWRWLEKDKHGNLSISLYQCNLTLFLGKKCIKIEG